MVVVNSKNLNGLRLVNGEKNGLFKDKRQDFSTVKGGLIGIGELREHASQCNPSRPPLKVRGGMCPEVWGMVKSSHRYLSFLAILPFMINGEK